MPKIQFHKKEKILSVRLAKGKGVDSDIKGNMVIDYDAKGRVVNIDIMDINLETVLTKAQRRTLAIADR